MSRLYVVMGVAGSGKSSIGALAADILGATYIDGDDFHPTANIEKMRRGDALTDEDRWPWLKQVAAELAAIDGVGLIGCSALKKSYRDLISNSIDETVTYIFLAGSRKLIASRMSKREGHFMPTSLLDSQFAALEVPTDDENTFSVDIDATPEKIAETMSAQIRQLYPKTP